MLRLSPPVRVTLSSIALLTLVGLGALTLLLADRGRMAERAAQAELATAAAAFAAALDAPSSATALARQVRGAAEETGILLAVFDQDGRRLATSGPTPERLPAISDAEEGEAARLALLAGEAHHLATAASPSGRYRVLALRPADGAEEAHGGGMERTLAAGLLLWLIAVVGLGWLPWAAGRRASAPVERIAQRLATLDGSGDARAELDRVAQTLGPAAEALRPLAGALDAARAEAAEARSHVGALLQINPHYVLLCTLDGHIVDANPAFYAMSGLPFEAVRGNRIEVLDEVMPVEPLFELARRSLRENASIGGVEYAVVNRDDARRPVQVSLRAVRAGGQEAVVIQATDVANQRALEHQVSSFSDALDLMVDQRVAQLTAGDASVNEHLDEAGVLVIAFDEGGSTRRWSQAAERLTGRRLPQVPHFTAFTSVLGLVPKEREAFTAWFWDGTGGSRVQAVPDDRGSERRMLWRKATTKAGPSTQRLLVGVELPGDAAPRGDGAAGLRPRPGGVELGPFLARPRRSDR